MERMNPSPEQQSAILDLARSLIRHALEGTDRMPDAPSDPILQEPSGCFVSLHSMKDHALRGCVGRIDASQSLAEALRTASRQVLHDPRFVGNPVRLDELPELEIEVSVLSSPTPAPHPLAFEPLEQGIYLTLGNRTGCFLPQVARETGWTREQLLDRLCLEKLGLPAGSWRNPQVRLDVFSVQVVGPEPFQPARPNLKTSQ